MIIHRPFQMELMRKFLFVALLINAILYCVNIYVYFKFNEYGESLVHQESQQFYQFFQVQIKILNKAFLASAICSTMVLAVYGIFLSHRIAGPLYNLKNHFKRIQQSKKPGDLEDLPISRFRSSDYFHDLSSEYNLALKQLKDLLAQKQSTGSPGKENVHQLSKVKQEAPSKQEQLPGDNKDQSKKKAA